MSISGSSDAEIEAIKIVVPSVSVKDSPSSFASTRCSLKEGVFLKILENRLLDELWIRVPCGWISGLNSSDVPNFEKADLATAEKSWEEEQAKRTRMASAITSMIIKSYPLPKAKRLVRSILKHKDALYPDKPITRVSNQSIEDIMIVLGGKTGLNKQQIFEYIKVGASQQSNPPQSILDIVDEIVYLMNTRPSLWVTQQMNVLETEDVRIRNDRFIMAAAGGHVEDFLEFLSRGQELTSLHSELKYTALHAAADFGKTEIVDIIIKAGLSLNIVDPRKGQTALHFAAYSGRSEICLQLLAAGADRKIGCNKGIKPYEAAEKQGHFECREILKYLPPKITTLRVKHVGINSISVEWDPPLLNLNIHADIIDYFIDCIPTLSFEEQQRNLITQSSKKTKRREAERIRQLGYRPAYSQTQTYCRFYPLMPSTEYSIRVKSQTLSGWSNYSKTLLLVTMPSVPDPPPPVEAVKITANGILYSWLPSTRDNGLPVDSYQIELMDHNQQKANEVDSTVGATKEDSLIDANQSKASTEDLTGESVESLPQSNLSLRRRSRRGRQGTRDVELGESVDGDNDGLATEGSMSVAGTGPRRGDQGGISKYYRLLRHKEIDNRFKYITGLEPLRPYVCRVRAHNELGFGPWSDWTGPVTPKPGANVAEFRPVECSARIVWFKPILCDPVAAAERAKAASSAASHMRGVRWHDDIADPKKKKEETELEEDSSDDEKPSTQREVEFYELQMCSLHGPLMKKIRLLQTIGRDGDNSIYGGSTDSIVDDYTEFVTVADDLTTNEFLITGLRAGDRYRVRIRYKVKQDNDWLEWNTAVMSDVFAMPSSVPEAPSQIRPALSTPVQNEVFFGTTTLKRFNKSLPMLFQAATDGEENTTEGQESEFDWQAHQLKLLEAQRRNLLDVASSTSGTITVVEEVEPSVKQDDSSFESFLRRRNKDWDPVTGQWKQPGDEEASTLDEDMGSPESTIRKLGGTNSSIGEEEERLLEILDGDHIEPTMAAFEITHNSIMLSWVSGSANGLPVEERVVECAKIRVYCYDDVMKAKDAFLPSLEEPEEVDTTIQLLQSRQASSRNGLNSSRQSSRHGSRRSSRDVSASSRKPSFLRNESSPTIHKFSSTTFTVDENNPTKNQRTWEWVDITKQGKFIDGHTFKAGGLIPGATYAFRVKQRNGCGWSRFSRASPLISTFPSVPPREPFVSFMRRNFAILQWPVPLQDSARLSNLEYEVQLRTLYSTSKKILEGELKYQKRFSQANVSNIANVQKKKLNEPEWEVATVRLLSKADARDLMEIGTDRERENFLQSKDFEGTEGPVEAKDGTETTVYCMIYNLISGMQYEARVRVRTIIGWSPWSASTNPFRINN